MTGPIDRRTFIRAAAVGGGSLVLGLWLGSCTRNGTTPTSTSPSTTTPQPSTTAGGAPEPGSFDANVLLRIDGDGVVTIRVPKAEMGQGVRTSLAMIIAEELDADWDLVRVETGGGDRRFGDQVTGGSLSVSSRYDSMRLIGATARSMLVTAAAGLWGVDASQCLTEPGAVVERDGNRRATYGELAGSAALLEPPSAAEVVTKDPADFRIIGRPLGAIDAPQIVTGAAVYGSDVRRPAMAHGVVARSPVFRGRVATWDGAAARAVAGVIDVFEVSSGIAVVASDTWAALRGRDALEIGWNVGDGGSLDADQIVAGLVAQLGPADPSPTEITADYVFPFNAHAAIETVTCVADARPDACEVWAATQDPQLAGAVAARGAGLPADVVTVHVPLIGGGFGRRLDQDFVEEAAELSAVAGRPVQLFWDRTDDLRHDRFHPAGVCRAVGDPAAPEQIRIEVALARNGPVPTGDWRSVSNAPEAFAHESFVDELAHAAGTDPYEYRRSLLDERARATLDAAAAAADWGAALPSGWGRGIAHHATWGVSPTTVVADVDVTGERIRVVRVVCAIDCGVVVNPDTVVAQLEGAVAFGTTAALMGGVTIADGAVVEHNFSDAPILRFDEMPEVEVVIVPSSARPTGVGEAGVPPMAPAIANAVFAATGRRLRRLPLSLG